MTFKVSAPSAEHLHGLASSLVPCSPVDGLSTPPGVGGPTKAGVDLSRWTTQTNAGPAGSVQCHGEGACLVAVLDEHEVPVGVGVATGPSDYGERLAGCDTGQPHRFDLAVVELYREAEVDLGPGGGATGDQSGAAFPADLVPGVVGK